MKTFLILFLNLVLTFAMLAQESKITDVLSQKMTEKNNGFIPIRIEFSDKVDCFEMNLNFKADQVPVDERPPLVIQALMDQSDLSQKPVRNWLKNEYPNQYKNLQSFWIANMMVLEGSPEMIQALALFPGIQTVDYENNRMIPHDKYIVADSGYEKSENGVEPGLEAINAPAMWALGYTGRGQVVYDYDTGVWPMHPAFTNRYMGNFFPTSQAWYGYHFDLPSGHINSHGTHTLGTIAGLVEATNDTIGVAFKSYWMANDYVEQTVQELLPITEMVTAFEWALNPDGDVSTVYDIPDVISNSWRWYDEGDQLHCGESFVVDIMNAIEAAGIANVFSGGNAGPNNETISSPQRINTSEVNTFSVGSVNATNFWFPYPISNFSSHGPTQCPGEGSLSIHPEVVAPGHNVRSAWGHDEFNTISGTSMATPHVAGAVLLLKEAFPYLSGEDLLWALYLTAIDLGDEGEDNIYGMGLIDVYAAYLYLSESNVPVDPNAVAWDLAITEVSNVPSGNYTCQSDYEPIVELKNLGLNTITSFELSYQINEGTEETYTWTGTFEAGETLEVELEAIDAEDFGAIELQMIAEIIDESEDYDLYNNRRIIRWVYRENRELPFQEGFENGFEFQHWNLENLDQFTTWDTIATEGLENNVYSASMQYFTYEPRADQVDGMVTPPLYLPASENTTLKFDRSYPKWQSSSQYRDTLRVLLSMDCGETWPHIIFEKYDTDLSTMDTLVGDFIPEYDTHWMEDVIDLSTYSGTSVLIKFEGTNKRGNNLYIDNIQIYAGETPPVSVEEITSPEVYMFPNPAHNFIQLKLDGFQEENVLVDIYDTQGKLVLSKVISNSSYYLEIDELAVGTYSIVIGNEDVRVVRKLVRY